MTIMKFVSGDGYSRMFESLEPEREEAEAAGQAGEKTQMRALWAVLRSRPYGHALSLDLQRLRPVIGDITPDMLWRAVDEADRLAASSAERQARMLALAAARELEPRTTRLDALVYYMQMANLVKIGTSTNLSQRLDDIRPQRLLAVEPGDAKVEHARHAEFDGWRSHGEWFHLSESLAEHIDRLRTEHEALLLPWADWKSY